jgi:peptidoglycan-associated lipoprotein
MNKILTTIVMGACLVGVSACSKKVRPGDLPPGGDVYGDGQNGPNGPNGPGGPGGRGAPGTQADFVQSIIADKIFFDTNRTDIDADDANVLRSQAQWLSRYPNKRVVVEGHCDERGTRDFNIALGARRANAAKNYLASLGVDPARISTVSYGKERPEAMGSNEEAWSKNRRAVTVTVQ